MAKVLRHAEENYIVEKNFKPKAHKHNVDCCIRVFYTCLTNIFDVLDHVKYCRHVSVLDPALWKEGTVTSTIAQTDRHACREQ